MARKNILSSLFGKSDRAAMSSPVRLGSVVRVPYGPFQFQFQIPKGAGYRIQASLDLQTWQPLAEGKSSGAPVDYVDAEASRFSYRFYRVLAGTVVSENAVGYATINLPPGYSMIANPLHAPSNTVSSILSGMPEGTTLNKFDTQLFRLTENAVRAGKWIHPDETLVPGEGAIFFNPTSDSKTVTFSGDVMQGNLLLPIAAGFSIRSSQIPKPGRLHTDLGFPISVGDVVHFFDRDRQKYVISEYDPQKWDSNPPLVGVGEAFWIGKTTPDNWVQNLVIK